MPVTCSSCGGGDEDDDVRNEDVEFEDEEEEPTTESVKICLRKKPEASNMRDALVLIERRSESALPLPPPAAPDPPPLPAIATKLATLFA